MDAEERISTMLGDPKRAIVVMAIPIMVALLVAEVNSLADRAWCSGLGVEALAAISVVRPIYNVYVGLGSGLGVGAAAVISRYIGANRPKDASISAIQVITMAFVFAIVLTPIMFAAQPGILGLIGSEDVQEATMNYMTSYTLCLVVIVMNGVVGGILNGQGAAGLSTMMMLVLAIGNMILDPIFIYVLGFGITGASMATVLATVMSLSVGIYYLLGRKTYLTYDRRMLKFDALHMKSITKAGVPQMFEYLVIYAMDVVLNMIVISCAGSEGLTIFSTPDAIVYIIVVPAMAVGSALVTVASSAYGQKDFNRMQESFRFSVKFGIGIVLTLVLVAELIPSVLMTMFTYSGEMLAYRDVMSHALRIIAIYAPMFSMTPICSGFLQAMRCPTYSVAIAIIRNLILILFFGIAAQFSLEAIYYALDFGHLIGMIIILAVTLFTFRHVRRTIGKELVAGEV